MFSQQVYKDGLQLLLFNTSESTDVRLAARKPSVALGLKGQTRISQPTLKLTRSFR